MSRVLAIVLLLISACVVSAAALPDDPAMAKPVTLAVKGEALSDVLKVMQEQTGVRLRVDRDIADQKATVFVDKKPLRGVMNGLSTVFGYRWSQETLAGNKTYRLWEDEKTRLEWENQRQKAYAKAWDQANAVFGYMSQYSQLKSDELKALIDKLTAEYAQKHDADTGLKLEAAKNLKSDPRCKPIADFYQALPESVTNAIKSGMSVYYDSATAEPEWKLPEDLVGQISDAVEAESAQHPSPVLMTSSPDGKTMVPFEDKTNWPLDGVALAYSAIITTEAASLDAAVVSRYKSVITAPASGGTPPTTSIGFRTNTRTVPLANEEVSVAPAPSESRLPHKKDGVLAAMKVSFDTSDIAKETGTAERSVSAAANRSDILAILHSKLGLQIISDHYSQWCSWSAEKSRNMEEFLPLFGERYRAQETMTSGVDWGWDGSYCYLRSMDAGNCDMREIPNRLLRGWQTAYTENGSLGLDELGAISLLTDEQTKALRMNAHCLGLYQQIETSSSLRLYGVLSAKQRAEAFGKGTFVADMTPEQQEMVAQTSISPNGRWLLARGVPIVGVYKNGVRIDKPAETASNPNETVAVKMELKDVEMTYQYETKTAAGPVMKPIPADTPEEAWRKVLAEAPDAKKENLICVGQESFVVSFLHANGSPFSTSMNIPTRLRYSKLEKTSGNKGN